MIQLSSLPPASHQGALKPWKPPDQTNLGPFLPSTVINRGKTVCPSSEHLASCDRLKIILRFSFLGHFGASVFPASTGLIEEIQPVI